MRFLLAALFFSTLSGCGSGKSTSPIHSLTFTISGHDHTIVFTLPDSPTPDGFSQRCSFNEATFCNDEVPVLIDGASQLLKVTFYQTGGLAVSKQATAPMFDFIGPKLFGGTIYSPHFSQDSYELISTGSKEPHDQYQLSIVAAP